MEERVSTVRARSVRRAKAPSHAKPNSEPWGTRLCNTVTIEGLIIVFNIKALSIIVLI